MKISASTDGTDAVTKHTASVIIPVYNSVDILPELIEHLRTELENLCSAYEIILVNDGSRDGSWDMIRDITEHVANVRGINLMRNYGQHNALLCGIREARYSVTVTLDDDLQHPPEEIPRLLEALTPEVDVVYGTPSRTRHPWGHIVAANLLKLSIATTLGVRTARIVSPFRAFRTHLRGAFRDCRSPWVIIDVYLTWATDRFTAVRVRHEQRSAGSTSYTPWKRFNQAWDMVAGFSTFPLRLASWVGFLFTLFGIGVLGYVLWVYFLLGGTIPGWAFLASTIAIFSGAQLFALGILGEYLARMFQRLMDRPAFAVVERSGSDEGGAAQTG
jgi:glycosyltransferase involved in cell wall biosynthesis